jgi:hypothetical protein
MQCGRYDTPMEDHITPIGKIDWHGRQDLFGIRQRDRFGHIYAIGKTGVGKSTLLLNMAINDIEKGRGICLVDPHGDIAQTILNYVPHGRIEDVIYFNPQDFDHPIAFNPLAADHKGADHLIVSGLVSAFKKVWFDSWGPRLEYILRFSLLSLLSYPNATLLHIQPLLTDMVFRNRVLDHNSNPHIIDFWKNEFEKYPPALKAEAIAPILNKTGAFINSIPLRNIVGQPMSSFSLDEVVNTKKIFIANLAKGQLGEDMASLLGSMLITGIQTAIMRRSALFEEERVPFFLYIDEMHSFVSLSFADMLSEVRKYKLGLFLTHQYIDQVDERIRKAIFGNIGTLITFRVGATDAAFLEKEFNPIFNGDDLINLPRYSMYIKLMIDGTTSKPFSAKTLSTKPFEYPYKKQIIIHSQEQYGKRKEIVEKEIFEKINKLSMNSMNISNDQKLF